MEQHSKFDPESLKSSLKKNTKLSNGTASMAPRESVSAATTRSHRNAVRRSTHLDTVPLSTVDSREERKANGRMVAVCVALFLIFLGLYHAWIRRTAVVAGVIVPVLIMLLYTAWVLYSAKRHKRKMMMLQNATSLNSVNCADRDSISCTSDETAKAKEINRNPSPRKSNTTVKFSHFNEISPTQSRNDKQDNSKIRPSSGSLDTSKPLAKVLPRQQKPTVQPLNLKEIPQHRRRLSLDQHTVQVHFKNDPKKERHGSFGMEDNPKHARKTKSNRERVSISNQ